MRILYFAWLREKAGIAEETISLPQTVTTVAELIEWQQQRDEGFAEAFAERMHERVRREFWAYAENETLENEDLIRERQPALPRNCKTFS